MSEVGWWMWPVMVVGTIAFWIAVVFLVRAILPTAHSGASRPPADPLEGLNRQFARGELTDAEYEHRRRRIVDGY